MGDYLKNLHQINILLSEYSNIFSMPWLEIYNHGDIISNLGVYTNVKFYFEYALKLD